MPAGAILFRASIVRGAVNAETEMPRYQSHKKVWALKIKAIKRDGEGSATITPEEPGYAPFEVDAEYMRKHQPKEGGYFVIYEGDGYRSWSPADVFEAGYSRIA